MCLMSALGIADVWDDCRALWGILRVCSCFTAYNFVEEKTVDELMLLGCVVGR